MPSYAAQSDCMMRVDIYNYLPAKKKATRDGFTVAFLEDGKPSFAHFETYNEAQTFYEARLAEGEQATVARDWDPTEYENFQLLYSDPIERCKREAVTDATEKEPVTKMQARYVPFAPDMTRQCYNCNMFRTTNKSCRFLKGNPSVEPTGTCDFFERRF